MNALNPDRVHGCNSTLSAPEPGSSSAAKALAWSPRLKRWLTSGDRWSRFAANSRTTQRQAALEAPITPCTRRCFSDTVSATRLGVVLPVIPSSTAEALRRASQRAVAEPLGQVAASKPGRSGPPGPQAVPVRWPGWSRSPLTDTKSPGGRTADRTSLSTR